MLDQYVRDQACELQVRRHSAGKQIIPISINLSRKDLLNDEFLDRLAYCARDLNIPYKYIRFEITESAFYNISTYALEKLSELRGMGTKLLIDDFGKGYSSLGTLAEQEVDLVKLDMSFIKKIGENPRAEAIIAVTVELAHKMGAQVIAEGVETEAQLMYLREIECDYIQGYYYSKPLSSNEFEALLDQQI